MDTPTEQSDATIESLLAQRAQYEQWLHRLDATGDKAPPAVRQRVRSDYEGRLQGVIQQLRGHAATINEELERHQARQTELDRERRQAEEALAEAEVRHAVGEYAEEEWQQISGEGQQRLDRVREDLRTLGGEIARLAEVQALISPPRRTPPPPPAPAPTPAPEYAPQMEEAEVESEPVPPAAARPVPQTARASDPAINAYGVGSPAPAPLDELTFLKSVSDDERAPAVPAGGRRPSHPGAGAAGRADAGAAPSPAPAASPPAPPPGGGQARGPVAGVAKTLKCGECGTLNRPTEWYCERCGAELAGL